MRIPVTPDSPVQRHDIARCEGGDQVAETQDNEQAQDNEEAAVAGKAARPGPGIRPLAPPVTGVRHGRAVLRTVTGPRLHERIASGTCSGELLYRTGALFADLHSLAAPTPRAAQLESPPWAPVLLADWLGLSPRQRGMLARLHTSAAARGHGREVTARLHAGSVWLHGDARADNVCVEDGSPLLVDWDRSGVGRCEADLGAFAASIVAVRLATGLPRQPDARAARRRLAEALADARVWLRPFLAAYRDRVLVPPDPELLARAVGAALITRAWARGATGNGGRTSPLLLHIGTNLLCDPTRWRVLDDAGPAH